MTNIQAAVDAARPGDTVVVAAGVYTSPVTFHRGGLAGAPITVIADGQAVFKGTNEGSGAAFDVSGVSYITIKGFTFRRFDAGIAAGSASHLVFGGSTFDSNAEAGIQLWKTSYVDVVNNRFLDAQQPYPGPAIQDYGLAIYWSDHVSARGNYFYGDHNQALSFKHGVSDSEALNNVFEGCMYTCLFLGQNDDTTVDDTSWNIVASGNTMRPVTDPTTGIYYRVSIPLRVRNVTGALVENNTFDPTCLAPRVVVEPSPNLYGRAAGNNIIRNNG